ncbi:outer membrane beta-barrel protein [Sphingomonas sp.]|uniref:outer membrane protein n=1 Tax=Sphingomonas sp. TaxID=28214 RepID=UPI000DB1FCAF|nr:outer membrane beta-barrel protein [Sphingomonas sp.]PZU07011.1 MAG: porin family protein [Sphingomonas sp.]
MFKFAPLAMIGIIGAAAPAFAQDADAAGFTGARVEGIVGLDRNQAYDDHKDGAVYGIGAGYDVALGHSGKVIAGLEGEINDSTAKVCGGAGTAADPRLCARAARDLYVGGRVGTVVGGRTLLYAKAGYTNGRYKFTSDDGSSRTTLARTDLDGVRVGAGAEYALGPNTYVKAEYRYSNYEQGVSRHQLVGGFGMRF